MALQANVKGPSKLVVTPSEDNDDENDDQVAASFLGVDRNIVGTAREPKPPKDYVDSSTNVLDTAKKQKSKEKSISIGSKEELPSKPLPTKASVLTVTPSEDVDDENDEEVAASFLGVNRNIVKTAHEPKPPKDYVESSTNVLDKANKPKSECIEQKQSDKKENNIRRGPSISIGSKLESDQIDSTPNIKPRRVSSKKNVSKLVVTKTQDVEEENDDEIAASFLGVSREVVKTAHEPKPPKDYVDSSTNVLEAAKPNDNDKNSSNATDKKKEEISRGPSISISSKQEINGNDNKQTVSKLMVTKSDDVEQENDDEVAASFLGVSQNFVGTAREPKPPKDYIDETKTENEKETKMNDSKNNKASVSKLVVTKSDDAEQENDDEVAASFLGVSQNFVGTARAPKPPKDYVDETKEQKEMDTKSKGLTVKSQSKSKQKTEDENDEEIAASFLGVKANVVKTAREPKPPKDYLASILDDDPNEKNPSKPNNRGTSISITKK